MARIVIDGHAPDGTPEALYVEGALEADQKHTEQAEALLKQALAKTKADAAAAAARPKYQAAKQTVPDVRAARLSRVITAALDQAGLRLLAQFRLPGFEQHVAQRDHRARTPAFATELQIGGPCHRRPEKRRADGRQAGDARADLRKDCHARCTADARDRGPRPRCVT